MNSIIYYYFEDLKQYVLIEANINYVASYECRKLSTCIERKLNKKISVTTIKRIYGFAQSKFDPSAFTLDTMSQFCGFKGWVDFCNNRKGNLKTFHRMELSFPQFAGKD